MTEDELMAAVHEYAEWLYRPLGAEAKAEIMALQSAKLLEAIEKYAQDRIAKLPSPLAVLLAKAAVCDAYTADESRRRHAANGAAAKGRSDLAAKTGGQAMTEGELMTAIHSHELHVRQCQLLRQEPTAEARAKLLEAIHAWTEQKRRSDFESLDRYHEIVGAYNAEEPMLRAKAAVCDAYRSWDYDSVHDGHSGLRDALSALRKLEDKP